MRAHAGAGGYYDPLDAQRIFDGFSEQELGITPLFFDNAFYCRRCGATGTARTCPHDGADRLVLSGAQVREMLQTGIAPPPELTRPEVARVLLDAIGEGH